MWALNKLDSSKENGGKRKNGELDGQTMAGVAARTVYSDGHLRNRCHALWDRECVCTRVWSSTVPC